MRGIEAVLVVLGEVERGAFAAESIRRLWPEIVINERKLTTTLVYSVLRRLGLWRHLLARYCRRPVASLDHGTANVLLTGIAGVLELEHFKPGVLVNALVQLVKDRSSRGTNPREHSLVNAVLHSVMEDAPPYIERLRSSNEMRDAALVSGVPGWIAAEWSREWGIKDARRLLQLTTGTTYMTVRLSPGVDRAGWMEAYRGSESAPSDISKSAVLLQSNPYPPDLPGYAEGIVTPQGESSIWAVECLLSHWQGGVMLDMCMGRGVKAGHILSCRSDVSIEGWDLSRARLEAAGREFGRLGVAGRVRPVCGDAASMTPEVSPTAIMLDVPCSGSGTWGRRPEGKWRMTPEKLKAASLLQERLFSRAADLLSPGGVLMYSTCSIFREENEKAVGAVMSSRTDLVELPVRTKSPAQKKGRPYGTLMFPESPWLDGFYVAIFKKKR
ncbi:MAG: RNA methyltransferase [Synergistaceae bacterium]|jgi:16S rRNA (cytosine967-C5)-methyltransferase|nr:RNA methyltransferase [Synergistaceae bacterium]